LLILIENADYLEISYKTIKKLVSLYDDNNNTLIVQILSNLCWKEDRFYEYINRIFSKYNQTNSLENN
jgi:hypothetical protein